MTVEIYEVRGTFPDMTLAYHTGRTAATKDAKQCQGAIEPMTVDLTKKGIVAFANRLWEWRDKGIIIENENENTQPIQGENSDKGS